MSTIEFPKRTFEDGRAFDKQPEVGRGQTPSFPLGSDSGQAAPTSITRFVSRVRLQTRDRFGFGSINLLRGSASACFDLRKQSYRCAYDMPRTRCICMYLPFRPRGVCDICSSDFVTFTEDFIDQMQLPRRGGDSIFPLFFN